MPRWLVGSEKLKGLLLAPASFFKEWPNFKYIQEGHTIGFNNFLGLSYYDSKDILFGVEGGWGKEANGQKTHRQGPTFA